MDLTVGEKSETGRVNSPVVTGENKPTLLV